MKRLNLNLNRARVAKNDEFYTYYFDIQNEIKHYKDQLENKVVYCNCDDPKWSNFYKYFKDNFNDLKLKTLITTHYNKNNKSYKLVYDGKTEFITELTSDGDFRSDECIKILNEADIIITNPPFSLMRVFLQSLLDNNKDFLIIVPITTLSYSNMIKYFINDKIRYGYNIVKCFLLNNAKKSNSGSNISWLTTLNIKNKPFLFNNLKYDLNNYIKYDNDDAINVSKIKEIPDDYMGYMGVPISFVTKINREQFDVVSVRKGKDGKDLKINGKYPFTRIIIKRK